LYSPFDTDPHKWQVRVTAPTICDFRSAAISFGLSSSAPKPFRLLDNFFSNEIAFDGAKNRLATPLNAAIEKWNSGRFPTEPGEHRNLPIYEKAEVLIDNGYNDLISASLTVSLIVRKQLFFGQQPIDHVSGFKDELSGAVITNAFTIGILDPDDVWDRWQRIASEEDVPVKPLLRLTGLVGWAA
jgi:hypothetical protein